MIVDIPNNLVSSVADAVRAKADWYRRDKGHPPEGIAELNAAADELDTLADEMEMRIDQIESNIRAAVADPRNALETLP